MALNANPNSKANFALNYFADFSDAEFAKWQGASEPTDDGDRRLLAEEDSRRQLLVSGGLNWATSNMTPVKNQGACGSCVAFATSSIVEGLASIKNSTPATRLSEQHMVDCATKYGNFGCGGGYLARYGDYVQYDGAVAYGDYRAYTATDGTCVEPGSGVARTFITGHSYIGTSVSEIATRLESGPMELTIGAGNNAFRYYNGGVMTAADGCPTSSYDHAVTIVGYATKMESTGGTTTTCRSATRNERRAKTCSDGSDYQNRRCCTTVNNEGTEEEVVDYWIVQNSWSTGWGESGFVRFSADEGAGICGMNRYILQMRM